MSHHSSYSLIPPPAPQLRLILPNHGIAKSPLSWSTDRVLSASSLLSGLRLELLQCRHSNNMLSNNRFVSIEPRFRKHSQLAPSKADRLIFTTRCYASAVLAMALCPSIRLSVPSQVRVLLKQLNVGSHKQHHTIAQGV